MKRDFNSILLSGAVECVHEASFILKVVDNRGVSELWKIQGTPKLAVKKDQRVKVVGEIKREEGETIIKADHMQVQHESPLV